MSFSESVGGLYSRQMAALKDEINKMRPANIIGEAGQQGDELFRPADHSRISIQRLATAVGVLQGIVASMQFNPQRGEPAGFYDLPAHDHCPHPQHNPAYGIYVPPGKGYRHVCPGCGFSFVIRGS